MQRTIDEQSGAVVLNDLNRKALVVRDNHLIHGSYRMNAREVKLFLWLVSQVRKEDEMFQKYRVRIEVLRELLGLEGRSIYSEAAAITRSLISRVAEIYDADRDRLIQRAMVIGADHVYGEGYVELQLHPDLKPYVLELTKNFTSIELEVAMRLPTFYAIRIYEIAKSYRHRGQKFEISLEELRKMLGIEEEQYKEFRGFAKRVLRPACEEVSKRTDIQVSFDTKRFGRSIGAIQFIISEGRGSAVEYIPGTMRDEWLKTFERHGMPRDEAQRTIKKYGDDDPERIVWHLAELKRLLARNAVKKTPLAWLRAALKNDYRSQSNLFSDREEQEADRKKRQRAKATLDRKVASGATIEDGFKGIDGALGETLKRLGERIKQAKQSA